MKCGRYEYVKNMQMNCMVRCKLFVFFENSNYERITRYFCDNIQKGYLIRFLQENIEVVEDDQAEFFSRFSPQFVVDKKAP